MKKLAVPANICLRKELWPGFGKKEAVYSGTVTGIVLAAMAVFCQLRPGDNSLMVATFSVVLALGLCIGLFSRIDGTQSIYEFLMRQAAYRREQQVFPYKRREEVYSIAQEERGR